MRSSHFCFPDSPTPWSSLCPLGYWIIGQTSCCQCKWMESPGCSHLARWVLPVFELRMNFIWGPFWALTSYELTDWSTCRGIGRSSSATCLSLYSSTHSFTCWAFMEYLLCDRHQEAPVPMINRPIWREFTTLLDNLRLQLQYALRASAWIVAVAGNLPHKRKIVVLINISNC